MWRSRSDRLQSFGGIDKPVNQISSIVEEMHECFDNRLIVVDDVDWGVGRRLESGMARGFVGSPNWTLGGVRDQVQLRFEAVGGTY